MKFLCDKCKTRYSIGDDRVRGKILKIRCKNCANVITVREGMDAEAAAEDAAANPSRGRPTTGVQAAMSTKPAGAPTGTALGAAFADQLAKPPPALEEEWYVSIDGVQSGPYSLVEAQRWITAKPFDAELHCWSEGFDDWLPVDKVSHFRNLRKKPEPRAARQSTVPPPIPKREDEPKPLFAATMASLEKGVTTPAALPPHKPVQPSTPAVGRPNGHTSPAPISTGRGSGPSPAIPKLSPGAAALAAAFKEPADDDSSEPMTRVEAPPFDDEVAKPAAKPVVKPIHHDDDDDLEIGEVSRVVKLADLASMGRRAPTSSEGSNSTRSSGSMPRINTAQSGANLRSTGSMPRLSATGAVPRIGGLTGSTPRLSPSELGMNVDPSFAGKAGGPHADESMVASSFASKHRRGLLLLLTVSAVMVLGVVAAVVFVVSGGSDEEMPGGLGGTRQIDTSRPEDIVRRALQPGPGEGPGSAVAKVEKPRPRITNTNPNNNQTPEVEDPKGGSLRASDVEDMAAKQGEGTKRCYMRAQKGAIGFEIADLKKIEVTLTVGKNGVVNDVNLSSHGADSFGQCLIARIKGWKFRESNGGTFRISLAFSAS